MRINSETELYAIIGDPVEHSVSPIMQNVAFRHLDLNCVYLAFQVKPSNLKGAIEGLKTLGIRGFNVTIPHKVSVMKYLDEVDSKAVEIGAVNTVLNRNGKLIGYNTDGAGALEALRAEGAVLDGGKVILLGAGGAAKALAFALSPLTHCLVILNRTESRAVLLASEIATMFDIEVTGRVLTREILIEELENTDIVINATPVGMHPKTDVTLLRRNLIRSDMTIFDLIYNPPETLLIREAKAAGAKWINGIKMLVYQGALSFQIWTGASPSSEEMLRVVEMSLGVR